MSKIELALREAEPEVLRQRLNTHIWCRGYPPKIQQLMWKKLMKLRVASRGGGA
ncbi:TPA: hypothetical protein ACH3X2_001356 [Trebouxia sp. C0005]